MQTLTYERMHWGAPDAEKYIQRYDAQLKVDDDLIAEHECRVHVIHGIV